MVNAECQIFNAEDKEFALLKTRDDCLSLTFNGVVAGLCRTTELTATKYSLPSCFTAPWGRVTRARTVFLSEPVTHAKLGPVCCQGSGQVGIEGPNTVFALPDNFLFGGVESCLELL